MRLGVAVLKRPSRVAWPPLAGLVGVPAWLWKSQHRQALGSRPAQRELRAQRDRRGAEGSPAIISLVLISLVLLAAALLSVLELWFAIPVSTPAVAPGVEVGPCGDGTPELPTRSERIDAPARIGPAFTC